MTTFKPLLQIVLAGFLLLYSFIAKATIAIERNVDCLCTGTPSQPFTLTAEGTAGPFTYAWSGPEEYASTAQNPDDISDAGQYSVVVTNAYGCEVTLEIDIPACPMPSGVELEILPGCSQGGGSVTVTAVQEGTAPYTFSWSNGGSGDTQTDIPAGDYIVSITDDGGCTLAIDFIVPERESDVEITTVILSSACTQGAGGRAEVSATGSAPPFAFTWSNGDTDATLGPVAAGLYQLTLTDADGCALSQSVFIPGLTGPVISNVNTTADCGGQGLGAISFTLIGDAPPFQVSWGSGALVAGSSGGGPTVINNLPSGNYAITATDASGCVGQASAALSNNPQPQLSANITPATCNSNADGAISLNITGTLDNNIQWSDGPVNVLQRTGLDAGEYCVTVTSPAGCAATACYNTTPTTSQVSLPYVKRLRVRAVGGGFNQIIYDGQWVSAAQGCLVFTGGTTDIPDNLMAAMANGVVFLQITGDFSEVMDANGSSTFKVVNDITGEIFPQFLAFSNNGLNFTSDVSTSIVQQLIENNSLEIRFEIVAHDGHGYSLADMWEASEGLLSCVFLPQLQPDCSWTPDNTTWGLLDDAHRISRGCIDFDIVFNESSGLLCIDVDGVIVTPVWTAPSGEQFQQECIVPATNGLYCVFFRVAGFNCDLSDCFYYCKPQAVDEISFSTLTPCTPQTMDGEICVESNGFAFQVNWLDLPSSDPADDDACRSMLTSGQYCAKITGLQCEIGFSYETICTTLSPDNTPLTASLSSVTSNCQGQSEGDICIQISGGSPPYAIEWETGAASTCISGLVGGCYFVTITDRCNRRYTNCYTVPEILPTPPTLTAYVTANTCPGMATGAISIYDFEGSNPPYSFYCIDEQQEVFYGSYSYIHNLPKGNYILFVSDGCGVEYSYGNYIIKDAFNVSIAWTDPACPSNNNGSAQLNIATNSPPPLQSFTYLWSNGSTSNPVSGLEAGEHIVTISSSQGCTEQLTVKIKQYTLEPVVSVKSSCIYSSDGEIEIKHLDVYSNGALLRRIYPTDLEVTWSNGVSTNTLSSVPSGEYCYEIAVNLFPECTYQSSNNICECIVTGCVTVPNYSTNPLIVNVIDVIHPNFIDIGMIEVLAQGGIPPYSYLWSNGGTLPLIDELAEGTYTLTTTDSNGCESIIDVVLTDCFQEEEPYESYHVEAILVTPLSISGGDDGKIEVILQQGNRPIYFHWTKLGNTNFHRFTSSITNLTEGEYCLAMTDGCSKPVEFCRLIVYCGEYDIAYEISNEDGPCRMDPRLQDHFHWGSIEANIEEFYGSVSVNWQRKYSSTSWYQVPYDLIQNNLSPPAGIAPRSVMKSEYTGTFRVIISDLTTCREVEEIYLDTGLDASYGTTIDECWINWTCNEQGIPNLNLTDEPVVIFDDNPYSNHCSAERICRLNGTREAILGDIVSITLTGQSPDDGYCRAKVVCQFSGFQATNEIVYVSSAECIPGSTGGEVSEGDEDGDGVLIEDNCEVVYNPDQEDNDEDGQGDVCDCDDPEIIHLYDSDGDGVHNQCDNCPNYSNPAQTDSDGDGIGDGCDACNSGTNTDTDGDGLPDLCDSCPNTAGNVEMIDSDLDGVGDECDKCPNTNPADISQPNPDAFYISQTTDTDGDGIGDGCDPCPEDPQLGGDECDSDEDGIPDYCDSCPEDYVRNESGCCIMPPPLWGGEGSGGILLSNRNQVEVPISQIPVKQRTVVNEEQSLKDTFNIHVFPNPASSIVNIEYSSLEDGIGFVRIINLHGVIIYFSSINVEKGVNLVTFDTSESAPGLYFVEVWIPNAKVSGREKLLIVR